MHGTSTYLIITRNSKDSRIASLSLIDLIRRWDGMRRVLLFLGISTLQELLVNQIVLKISIGPIPSPSWTNRLKEKWNGMKKWEEEEEEKGLYYYLRMTHIFVMWLRRILRLHQVLQFIKFNPIQGPIKRTGEWNKTAKDPSCSSLGQGDKFTGLKEN